MVDANGKEIPWVDNNGRVLETVQERYRTAPEQRVSLISGIGVMNPEFMQPRPAHEQLMEFTPPFYADLPSMPEHERKAIFGLMVGQEGKTNIPVYYALTQAGFDPDQDMLQNYGAFMAEMGFPQWRMFSFFWHGGLVTDWNLMTNLEGLFAAGEQLLTGKGIAHACATGRYAGRKAAEFALTAEDPAIGREQVEAEKNRVYAPIRCKNGMDWKELEAGIAKVMQDYCGAVKNEELLALGLKWLDEIKEGEASQLSARNPHELTRALEVLSILEIGEMVIHACRARKASSAALDFMRSDYPEVDPPEWHKWIVIKLAEEKVKVSELPLDFWGDLKEHYEAHCGL
jgi:succinate dehydrogenase/fumarate reductase flavoprotein subunit